MLMCACLVLRIPGPCLPPFLQAAAAKRVQTESFIESVWGQAEEIQMDAQPMLRHQVLAKVGACASHQQRANNVMESLR